MKISEYIAQLDATVDSAFSLCNMNKGSSPCKGCPIGKNDGKPCPIAQLQDVRLSLAWAVEHNFNGITMDSEVYSASVIAFLRRAVVMGYSVRTLRFCSEDYIKERNLVEITKEVNT